jgi:restriction endonuclease S subunit
MKDFKVINDRPSIVIVNTPAIDVNRLEGEFYKYDYLNAIDKIKKIRFLPLENLVDDIKDGPGGWDINISDYVEQGVPMLRTINIVDGLVNLDECVFIDIEKHKQLKRSKVVKNDVLLSVRGTIGKSAVYSKNFEANINAALVKITLKDNIIDPYFLVAFFNCKYGRLQTERIANGAVQLNMNLTEAKSNLIPIPSPEIQKYIGDKVRKAEELREEAKKLKKEAEEILNNELNVKELLIKIDRYTEKHSWIMNSDINDRMDALYYNPQKITIKKFYKNYNLQKLKDLVDYKKGYAFKSEDYCNNTSTFLLRVSDISNNEVDMCNMLNLPDEFYQEYKDFNLINGDIVMVVTGNTTGKSIVINNNKFKLLLNQNAIRMRIKEGIDISPYYIELILQSQYFQTLLKYSLYQSVQPFISMEFLNDVVIPIIDKTKIENISNLYEKSLNNLFYAKQLIQEAKQDVEDLIEGNFDMSKVRANS